MKVLGINTSTVFGSVGIVDNDHVMAEYSINGPVTHSERLMPCVDRLLADTHVTLEEIDGFSITVGPGSFTGLRIGISAVKGLAFVTGRPVTGVSSLEALALNVYTAPQEVCPILDARKKEVYAARFRSGTAGRMRRLTPDLVISPQDLVESVQGTVLFLGDGLEVYGNFLKRKLGQRASFAPPELGYIHGAVVARMGVDLLKKGKTLDPARFVPHYIRRSEAEIKYGKGTHKKPTGR